MFKLHLILERQWLHALLLVLLLIGVALSSNLDDMGDGALWGISTTQWFWLAIALAIAHQVFVWFCWRTQLHGQLLDRIFGNLSFSVYAVVFFILGALRVSFVVLLAISNRDTLPVNITILRIIAVITLIPAGHLLYSVKRYFSFKRAFGVDHFDKKYRTLPLVREGIFRFTQNSMYTFGFLFLWVPAFWNASVAAMCAALFNHIYIWVHYYATELPDMKRIYGENQLTNRD